MKIEMEHVCRDFNSYGGTEAWAWLRKLVLVYGTVTGGNNKATREKIQIRGSKYSLERKKYG